MLPEVQKYLEKNNIMYIEHKHPPVFTVEEAKKLCKDIPGLHCKNLFLKDKKKQYYLVVVPAQKRVDIRKLEKQLGTKKLGFGSAERLMEVLKLEPGSVSPLGLMHDTEQQVIPIIDQEAWDALIVGFHPNENTATLEMNQENFHRLLESFGCEMKVMEINPMYSSL
jgi:Ala-tRNA(Pro) deacylase